MEMALALIGVLIFAAASFFFALAESALFSLGKWRAQQLAERSPALGGAVTRLLNQPQDLLATIVLGNTFANAGLVALALGVALREYGHHLGLTLAGLFVFILLGGEVVPKTLAVRMPETWALRVARPMEFFLRLTRPLRAVAQWMNGGLLRAFVPQQFKPLAQQPDEEYRELVELAVQHGTLAQSEKEIIFQIISLDHRTAREVMQPRARMACISDELSVEEMLAAARQQRHTRLPIFDETPDTIVGVLNTRALLLDPQIDLAEAIEFPSFVPEQMNLLQLLKALQQQKRGLAVVLDEFGSTAGVVTMEDILHEIIGVTSSDGGDHGGFVMEKLGEGRWRVNGTMRLDDFRREYPDLGAVPEVDTLAGLVLTQLEVVPTTGQSVTFSGLKFTVTNADERRVHELLVERQLGAKAKISN